MSNKTYIQVDKTIINGVDMMYELISQEEANRIIEILESTPLHTGIEMRVGEYTLKADNVSESADSTRYSYYKMREFYLLDDNDELGVLEYNNRKYEVFVNLGDWGYDPRLKDVHITLGSNRFHEFSFQIELSQAIKDGDYIYIVKNISNMSGPGAMVRLYRGLKKDRDKKLERQDLFVQKYGQEVINYEGKDWVCISKIKREDLETDDKKKEILYDLLYNMMFAMLLVETIGDKHIV